MLRALNGVMAALFALSAAVQFNDPDPLRWIAVYAAAAIVSAAAAFGRRVAVPAAVLAVVSLVWAIAVASEAKGVPTLAELVDFQMMKTSTVELARETLGLGMIFVWMAVLAVAGWRRRV